VVSLVLAGALALEASLPSPASLQSVARGVVLAEGTGLHSATMCVSIAKTAGRRRKGQSN